MPTILGRLTGVSFQTELLVMTFLGLVNSLFNWSSFDWTIMVEKIRNINLKSEYFGDVVKTVLSWVVIARIIIAHLYTVTYLANFYSIFTRCRPNVLLPWMIVSGFKNFILEFIVIMVCLLLYSEREFPSAWLTAFIVCKLISLVPAVYYWLTVNSFFVELVGIQRRKLTRANLASSAEGNFSWSADVGERLRFRSTFAGGFAYRQRIFMSLVNLDDFLLNSSLEFDGERDNSKIFKSLVTLESQESEHPEEDSRLQIVEDESLTPVEKSLRILGLNRDDINKTRVRLGKNVLPTGSNIEDIEEIVSTVEPKDDIEPVDGRSTEHKKTDVSIVNATMGTENNVETDLLSRNVRAKNEAHSSSKLSKLPAGNTPSGCTCRKAKERSVVDDTVDSGRKRKRPSNDSSCEGRSNGYEEENDHKSINNDSPADHPSPSEKQLENESKVVTVEPVKNSLEYPEEPKRTNGELFRVDDGHLKHDNLAITDSYMNAVRSYDVQAERSLLRIVDDRLEVYTQTDFVNDAGQWKSNTDLAEDDLFRGTQMSTATQTNISDCWRTTIFRRTSNISIDRNKNLFRSKPSGRASLTKATLFSRVTKFSRPKIRPETIEEREAREMRALRIYNNRTLFKTNHEIETRKENSAFGNHAALQNRIFTTKDRREFSKTPREKKTSIERLQGKLDQMPKRQARSRPQQRASKLRDFNVGLDALEYAISLSFSSEKKNRTTHKNSTNNTNEIPPIPPRKQLSKYSKSTRIPEGLQRSSPSTTRFEGLQKGRNLDRTPGVENITDRKITGEINPGNCSSNIVKPIDSSERHDKHGISKLKDMIKNIDWGFKDDHDSGKNDAPSRDNFVSSGNDVLYDIIDDTDVISLLQSAFASNPGNTERGFYLGPGSTELYSVTNYLDDVIGEIIKTARLRPNPDAFANEPRTEVDYGESYLQEFQVTRLLALDGIDEETDSNSEASDDSKIEDITPAQPAEFDPLEPIEVCWSSYSGEGFAPQGHHQSLSSYNGQARKGIADLLGEKEISSLEFWTRELKNLASEDRRNDLEITKHFRHLTEIPGYCVVKTLVDFFREFVAVSRSTMTSRMFVSANSASTPSSLRSEEVISGGLNDHANISLNGDQVDPQDMTLVEIIDEDVADSLRKLIDRITENAECDDLRNDAIVGIHDDQTVFPLREDQFYFGPPGNTRLIVKGNLSPEFEAQNHEFIRNEELHAFHLPNFQPPQANAPSTNSSPEVLNDEAISSMTAKGLNSITLTVDSYDSFYSSGAAGTSKHSDNVISIGGESPFEDFTEDPLTSASSSESQRRYTADLRHTEN